MNIFIGKEQGNKVIGLIIAKNKDIAWTYFEGKYGTVSDVEEINITKLDDSRPYYCLLKTTKYSKWEVNDRKSIESIILIDER